MSAPAGLAAAALQRAALALTQLSTEELEALATGRGRLVFRPERTPVPPRASTPQADEVTAAVTAIRGLTSRADVADYLARGRFTVPVLKQIARALGPTVLTTARDKADLIRNIAEGTAGFRERSAAMSGGAWG